MFSPKPGWIGRQIRRLDDEYKTWPVWMRREIEKRVSEDAQEKKNL